jgi:hypothetical protein
LNPPRVSFSSLASPAAPASIAPYVGSTTKKKKGANVRGVYVKNEGKREKHVRGGCLPFSLAAVSFPFAFFAITNEKVG